MEKIMQRPAISRFEEANVEELNDECQQLLKTLPREKWWVGNYLYQYQGFWFPANALEGIIHFQKNFKAAEDEEDVFIIAPPKSGTTWLKALAFAIVNRKKHYPFSQSPLLNSNPHQLVRFLEFDFYNNKIKTENDDHDQVQCQDQDRGLQPRLFASHLPYQLLPASIKDSGCRIVYICRNPMDVFISFWHFFKQNVHEPEGSDSMAAAGMENMCKGVVGCGPYWDHVLGYWRMSIESPEKVLFLKYEDLKDDITTQMKRLAHFLGVPFSEEEEREGMVEEIAELCSLDNLRNLEVNVNGTQPTGIKNSSFFRKGEVGDWVNHVNPSMAEKFENLFEEKLSGSGLSFKKKIMASEH